MRKLTLGLSAAALALIGAGAVHAAPGGPGDKGGADADRDGVVTSAEHQAHAARIFARMDANADGAINADDRRARQAERFGRVDADKDGELSQAEMAAAREARQARMQQRREAMRERRAGRADDHFARLDTDGSGGLSQAELAAAREAMQERRGERAGGREGGERKMRGHHGGKRGAMAMLRMADTNGDKSVSQAEFTAAADKRFAAMDANADGSVTAEERQVVRSERRAARQAR